MSRKRIAIGLASNWYFNSVQQESNQWSRGFEFPAEITLRSPSFAWLGFQKGSWGVGCLSDKELRRDVFGISPLPGLRKIEFD